MKILLLTPPVFNDIGRALSHTPPLGLLYLAAFLEKNGYPDIKVIDTDVAKLSWQDVEDLLIREKPDVVGITGVSFSMSALIKTAGIARRVLPNALIVAGGFGPSKEPEKILNNERLADFVVIGEGEITFLEFLRQLEKRDKDFSQINGLAYLGHSGRLIITKPRDYIKDLNILPWPAYHLLTPEFSRYRGMHSPFKEMIQPTGILLASRGCPHRCAFCSLGTRMYRTRNPRQIVDEMEFYRKKFGVKSIQVYDDEFVGMSPWQNEHIKEICNEIIKRGLHKILAFWVQGRCSPFVELETLRKMREAGFVWISWGVESGSQKVLDSIQKDIKVEDVARDFDLARKAGIKRFMFLMLGFPGETKEDIKLTVKLIKKVKPDIVRFHVLTPYPGSKLRRYFEENNLLETDDYYKFDTRHNVIHHTKEMTAKEIKKYYHMLILRFENNPWYYLKLLGRSFSTYKELKHLFKRTKTAAGFLKNWVSFSYR